MLLFFLEISVAPHSKTNTPVTELLFEIASPHSLMHIQKTHRDVNFKHLCVKFEQSLISTIFQQLLLPLIRIRNNFNQKCRKIPPYVDSEIAFLQSNDGFKTKILVQKSPLPTDVTLKLHENMVFH